MAERTEAQLAAAEARGRTMPLNEMRATAARYDVPTGRIVIELVNGCLYAVPARLIQDLAGVDEHDLSQVVVDGHGFNLNWSSLDVDLYVPALIAGIFGTKKWMAREPGRPAGRTTAAAKTAAVRSNGARGGRPRKLG